MSPNGRNEHRIGKANKIKTNGPKIDAGGPVGSGGFSGRPGTGGPVGGGPGKFTGAGPDRGLGGAGLVGTLLLWLLSGRRSDGTKGSVLGKLIRIIIVVGIVLFLFRACTANQAQQYDVQEFDTQTVELNTPAPAVQATPSLGEALQYMVNSGSVDSGWVDSSNSGTAPVQTQVSGIRDKFYQPGKNDTVTVMLYMIGTDLESEYSMATADLQEISRATIGDNVNFILFSGGCKKWKNNVINKTDTIYQISNGGQFKALADAAECGSMTKRETLATFINYCRQNFPADRNILILWDHGGGSVTGYGYDQVYPNSGSMSLTDLGKALKDGGVKFDFVGLDACLMATAENAILLSDYADYMIASEESEPGIGWYYTNWVSDLSANTSIDTVRLGQRIVNDFVQTCAQQCRGQDTTLSVTDLAEAGTTLPPALSNFYNETAKIIESGDYSSVSKARSSAHEFAKSSRIDQCDLTHFALNMNSASGQKLASTIRSAVKYNKTGTTVSNAYGLSAYFPYRSGNVNNAINTLGGIDGLGDSYTSCMKTFATVQSSGQSVFGGSSGYSGLLEGLLSGSGYSDYQAYDDYGSSSYGSSYGGYEDMYSIISSLMSGRSIPVAENLQPEAVTEYIQNNSIDPSKLVWNNNRIELSEKEWDLITDCVLSVFADDGKGYIDLGYDIRNTDFNDDGSLNGVFDRYWLSVDYWPACFVLLRTDGTTETGYIPITYNGTPARMIIRISDAAIEVVGVEIDYSKTGETDTVAKSVVNQDDGEDSYVILKEGDKIVLLADHMAYDGAWEYATEISDPITVGVNGSLIIGDVEFDDSEKINACFKLTDIYGNEFWTPVLK